MRMDRELRRKRKWHYIRLLIACQLILTLFMLRLTSSSYALLADRELASAGTFASAFVFTKTVDEVLNRALAAEGEAAEQERMAASGCKDGDLEHAKQKDEESKQASSLARRAADEAHSAVDELDKYLKQAVKEVREIEAEVEQRLRDNWEQRGEPVDENELEKELKQDADVQATKQLYDYIAKALIGAEKSANQAERHAEKAEKSAEMCEQFIKKKAKQLKSKGRHRQHQQVKETKQQERQAKQEGLSVDTENDSTPDSIDKQNRDNSEPSAENNLIEERDQHDDSSEKVDQ